MYTRTDTKKSEFQILDAAIPEFQPDFALLRGGGRVILGHAVAIALTKIKNKPWTLLTEMCIDPEKWVLTNLETKSGSIRFRPTNFFI